MSIQQPSGASRIARNSAWNGFGWVSLVLLNIVAVPVMLDALGEARYGGYILVLSVIGPLGLLDFGITDATVKYVSEAIGRKDMPAAQGYVGSSVLFNLSIAVLGWLVISLGGRFVLDGVFDLPEPLLVEMRDSLVWAASLWALQQMRQSPTAIAAGLKRYALVNVGTSASQIVIVACGLLALVLGADLPSFLMSQAFAALAVLLAWWYVAGRLLPEIRILPMLHGPSLRATTSFGFWQMLNSSGGVLSQQSQRWLLGIFQTPAITGFFGMCAQLTGTVYMVAFRIGQVLLPEFSDLQGRGKTRDATALTLAASWIVTVVAASMFVPIAVFSHDILRVWVGSQIADTAAPALQIMCIGASVGAMFAVQSFYLLGSGYVRWLAMLGGANGVLVAALSWFMIQEWSLTGAAIAYSLATITHIVTLFLIWRNMFREHESFLRSLAATAIPLGVAWSVGAAMISVRELVGISPEWVGLGALGAASAVILATILLATDRIVMGRDFYAVKVWKRFKAPRIVQTKHNASGGDDA